MSLRIKGVVDKFVEELKDALDADIQDRIMKEREMRSYIQEREREVAEREAAWKSELSHREAEIARQEARLKMERENLEKEKSVLMGTASNQDSQDGALEITFKQKVSVYDKFGKPILTAADSSNPWWALLEGAVKKANGKLGKPEIFPASTDARYFRERGLPAIGFSPMANTPILLHDHNEFLNKDDFLKGIDIYESIIRDYASYVEHTKDEASREEL